MPVFCQFLSTHIYQFCCFCLQWRRKHFKSKGYNFFTVPPLFVVPPMTGHYRKVQGTVTRTELGGRVGRPYEAKVIFDFMQSRCVKGDLATRQSIEHEAWVVSYRSSVDTNSVSCSVSEILHLNPQTHFCQFRGTSAHTLAAGSRSPEGIWTPA